MAHSRHRVTRLVWPLIALMAVQTLTGPDPGRAADFPGSAHVLEGVATTKDGRPLSHATLFLFDLPPGQSWGATLGDDTTVVTDDRGHFTWDVPSNVVILADSGESAPGCWALAADRTGWGYSLHTTPHNDADFQRRDLLGKAALQCTTQWVRKGTHPEISVTVPDVGRVTMVVRGPDGRPLRDHAVQVFAPGTFSDYEGAVVYDGMTDAEGRLDTRWHTGLLRIQVLAPGIGFASTGTFELLPGQKTTPAIPPLAPFARLSGSVTSQRPPSDAIKEHPGQATTGPAASVTLEDFAASEHRWYRQSATVSADGQWTLTDVFPGPHHVVLSDGSASTDVTVGPGEDATGVRLTPKGVTTAKRAPVAPVAPAATETAGATARGTVKDTEGHPVAGATVYAVSSYFGGIRMYQKVLTATTDGTGSYTVPGLPVGQGSASFLLVASHPGYAPAEASACSDTPGGDVKADLVLPPPTTCLAVHVLRAGKPVTGASVRLTPQGGSGLFDHFYVGSDRGAARDAVSGLLAPTATTGPDGRAIFTGLAPGLWDVTASVSQAAGALDGAARWPGGRPNTDAFGTARGVIVAAGQTGDFTLNAYPQPGTVSFQVVGPGGTPPASPSIGLEFGTASAPVGSSTSLTLDKDGVGSYSLATPGLWRVATHFRDIALESFPATAEPYYAGETVVAVSPSVREPGPVVIHAVRHGPGRIRVRLQDAAGRPVRGAVVIGDPFESARYGASVDGHGEALFTNMPSGQYTLTAHETGLRGLPVLGRADEPFPSDAALNGVSVLLPQSVTVRSDAETVVTFRPQAQGYIRGWLHVAGNPGDYALYPPFYSLAPSGVHLDSVTGEFVAGPFPPGPALLQLSRPSSASSADTPRWQARVGVTAGKISRVSLTPEGMTATPASHTAVMLTMGGVFSADRDTPLSGTVLLPDGKTPAWGARVALVVPQTWPPVRMSRADAMGRLTEGDYWYEAGAPMEPPPGSPDAPVLVAWLPGTDGAVVVPYAPGQANRLVLPPPVSLQGQVTLAGQSVAGMDSSFRVLAACQGRGELNPLLSVEATAQADGSFTLAGLTPGTYRVQAARDGVWVSASQTVTLGGGDLPNMILDVPGPGQAIDLRLTDAAGRPLPEATVAVSHPDGPLTDALWPKTLTADGAGFLRLVGLAAGQTQLTVYAPASSSGHGGPPPPPLASIALDVPPFVAGDPPMQKPLRCGPKRITAPPKEILDM